MIKTLFITILFLSLNLYAAEKNDYIKCVKTKFPPSVSEDGKHVSIITDILFPNEFSFSYKLPEEGVKGEIKNFEGDNDWTSYKTEFTKWLTVYDDTFYVTWCETEHHCGTDNRPYIGINRENGLGTLGVREGNTITLKTYQCEKITKELLF